MRGDDQQQSGMFSYVSIEQRVPQDHPLRAIRKLVNELLRSMAKEFDSMYAKAGRPSVPPERLLRAALLQIFYSIRSERMLMEQMNYNLLFRWFVGLEMDEPVWNHAVFSKNRERLLNHEVARKFFQRVVEQARPHISEEHFTVDGTLIEAWASQKSFQKKDGGDDEPGEFRGEKRSNDTHESKTDPDAKLYRKGHGQEAKLGYLGLTGPPKRKNSNHSVAGEFFFYVPSETQLLRPLDIAADFSPKHSPRAQLTRFERHQLSTNRA
jgi:transposase